MIYQHSLNVFPSQLSIDNVLYVQQMSSFVVFMYRAWDVHVLKKRTRLHKYLLDIILRLIRTQLRVKCTISEGKRNGVNIV